MNEIYVWVNQKMSHTHLDNSETVRSLFFSTYTHYSIYSFWHLWTSTLPRHTVQMPNDKLILPQKNGSNIGPSISLSKKKGGGSHYPTGIDVVVNSSPKKSSSPQGLTFFFAKAWAGKADLGLPHDEGPNTQIPERFFWFRIMNHHAPMKNGFCKDTSWGYEILGVCCLASCEWLLVAATDLTGCIILYPSMYHPMSM